MKKPRWENVTIEHVRLPVRQKPSRERRHARRSMERLGLPVPDGLRDPAPTWADLWKDNPKKE